MSKKLKDAYLKVADDMEKDGRIEWAKDMRCLIDEVERLEAAQPLRAVDAAPAIVVEK